MEDKVIAQTNEVVEELTPVAEEAVKQFDTKKAVGIGGAVVVGLSALGTGAYFLLKHFANKE